MPALQERHEASATDALAEQAEPSPRASPPAESDGAVETRPHRRSSRLSASDSVESSISAYYDILAATSASRTAYIGMDVGLLVCISLFLLETAADVVCRSRVYVLEVSLDVIGTAAIILELSWISDRVYKQASNQSAATALVAGLSLARTFRVLRVLRALHLLYELPRLGSLLARLRGHKHSEERQEETLLVQQLMRANAHWVALVIVITVACAPALEYTIRYASAAQAFAASFQTQAGASRQNLAPAVDAFFGFYDSKVDAAGAYPVVLRVGDQIWDRSAMHPFTCSARDRLDIFEPRVALALDISARNRQAARLSLCLTLFVVTEMVLAVLLLNAAATALVMAPLHRIFGALRSDAGAILAAVDMDEEVEPEEVEQLGTLIAAVAKMGRILAHTSASGQQGQHVVRNYMQDETVSEKDKEYLSSNFLEPASTILSDSALPSGQTSATTLRNRNSAMPGTLSTKSEQATTERSIHLIQASAGIGVGAAPLMPPPKAGKRTYGHVRASVHGVRPDQEHGGLLHQAALQLTDPAAHKAAKIRALTNEVDLDLLNSWAFDVLDFTPEQLTAAATIMFLQLGTAFWEGEGASAPADGLVSVGVLWAFIDEVAGRYHAVPYHNFFHCMDVTHTTFRIITATQHRTRLTPAEKFALMVAAICHDVDHPGLNNNYLIATRDPLARTYNDSSVLENRHIACLYQLVAEHPQANVFAGLEGDAALWKDVRKMIIAAVLHTDMVHHFPIVSKLEVFYELHAAAIAAEAKREMAEDRLESEAGALPPPMFQTAEERQFVLNVFLHCADISNPVKPRAICEKWTDCVLAEFFAQGDVERRAGLPVSPLMDRTNTSRAMSQIGFIEFVVAPLFNQVMKIFPELEDIMLVLLDNRRLWTSEHLAEIDADAAKGPKERASEREKSLSRLAAFQEKYRHVTAPPRARISPAQGSFRGSRSGSGSQQSNSRGSVATGLARMMQARRSTVSISGRAGPASTGTLTPQGSVGGSGSGPTTPTRVSESSDTSAAHSHSSHASAKGGALKSVRRRSGIPGDQVVLNRAVAALTGGGGGERAGDRPPFPLPRPRTGSGGPSMLSDPRRKRSVSFAPDPEDDGKEAVLKLLNSEGGAQHATVVGDENV